MLNNIKCLWRVGSVECHQILRLLAHYYVAIGGKKVHYCQTVDGLE